ncbi:MAG: DoxX family protein [Moraxellaceae bacterium]|nr:DoxX family protein [Moraxellaceae bacterium]
MSLLNIAKIYHQKLISIMQPLHHADGLPALALRLYLVPIFWMAGTNKLFAFQDTVAWFGNSEWGLGLPLPWLMAALALSAEVAGSILLALGLFTRLIAIPLFITMIVAAITVHLPDGWQAIADAGAPFANDRVIEAADKLTAAKSLLQTHGNYEWLTESGNFVILNNGVEFAVTYMIMLGALMVLGGGRYVSLDFWIKRLVSK